MSRLQLVFVLVAIACGGKSQPAGPTAPLPADKPADTTADKPADKPADKTAPKADPEPPKPTGPISLTTEAPAVTVKLVSPGKGKKAVLAYKSAAGSKQRLELAFDFSAKQKAPAEMGGDQETTAPTIVLVGDAETTAAAADGVDYKLTVTSGDAREVAGSGVAIDAFKAAVGVLAGLTISGKIAPSGEAAAATTFALEKPDEASGQVIQIVQSALPTFPYLPKEKIGIGAKWQATTTTSLMGQFPITQVTDYELLAQKGKTWTIKGTTKISGADAELQGNKITGIQGSGTVDATLTAGALHPKLTSSLETQFTATVQDKAMTLSLKVASAVTPAVVPKK